MSGDVVSIAALSPAGPAVRFDLDGEDVLAGGVGGWSTVARPRNLPGLEWIATPEQTYTLGLLLDGTSTTGAADDRSVEVDIARVASWGIKAAKTGVPPILRVTGPVQVPSSTRWVLQDIAWAEKIRNAAGQRVQQRLTLTLVRYSAADVRRGPTKKARDRKKKKTRDVLSDVTVVNLGRG